MQRSAKKGAAPTCRCRDQSMINITRLVDSAPRFVCARCGSRVSLRRAPRQGGVPALPVEVRDAA